MACQRGARGVRMQDDVLRGGYETTRALSPAAVQEENLLAKRAAAGDQKAFDRLFELYFDRTARYFRHVARAEAEQAVSEVLEELFATLGEDERPFVARAYQLAR